MDFRSIALASQWQRVERGEVAVEDFDFFYAKAALGRHGWRKTQALIAEYETADPALAQEIRVVGSTTPLEKFVDWERVRYRPASLVVPAEVRATVEDLIKDRWGDSLWFYGGHDDALILFDVSADGRDDYLFIRAAWDRVAAAHIHLGDDGAWQAAVLAPRERLPHGTNLQAMLRNGGLGRTERTVQDFKVGDLVLRHRHDYEKGRRDMWKAFHERED